MIRGACVNQCAKSSLADGRSIKKSEAPPGSRNMPRLTVSAWIDTHFFGFCGL